MYCLSDFPPRVHYFYYFRQVCIIVHHAALRIFRNRTTQGSKIRGVISFRNTGCSVCIFCIIILCSILPLHFFFSLPHSVLTSLTVQHTIPHHTIPPVNLLLPQPYHFRRRLVVYSLTHPSLPQSLSSFVCSSVRRHWTKPRSSPFSLCALSTSSSFCWTIRSNRYTQPWPFLPYWNLDQTHYHRCCTSELQSSTLLTDQYSP